MLRTKRILGEATIELICNKELISRENATTFCRILDCQFGNLM